MIIYSLRPLVIALLLLVSSPTSFPQDVENISSVNLTCSDLDGAYVLSQEPSPVYLGFFGNQLASGSIMNSFGTYGSQFSTLSVRNTLGQYGSSFGSFSANNQFTSTPPRILKNGSLLAYLTTNTMIVGGISLATIDASCNFFSSSPAIPSPPPAAPTSVNASDGVYTDAIEVTWNAVPGADQYILLRAASLTDPLEVITVTLGTVTPVFDGVPGKVYWFWVAASNSSGIGNLSEPDSGYIAPTSSEFSLSVGKSGNGSGTVSSTPSGIDCGSTCSADYSAGAIVTLTVSSDIGSTFSGWSGDCVGAAVCAVTMNNSKSVTATFALTTPVSYTLTVNVTGNGVVTPASGSSYTSGTVVTLEANPDTGWSFLKWGGDVIGANSSVQVTMDRNKAVTAEFRKDDNPTDDKSSKILVPVVLH